MASIVPWTINLAFCLKNKLTPGSIESVSPEKTFTLSLIKYGELLVASTPLRLPVILV